MTHRAFPLQPALFLDRDGTLNREVGYISHPDQLRLIAGAAQAVARINASPYRAIVVTNQSVVARGDCGEEELQWIHAELAAQLGAAGAHLDAVYYCPHYPDGSFPCGVAALKIACTCRKPETGLIDRAARDLGIDLARSWVIGDTTTDLELARRAGCRSILVHTGHAGKDGRYPTRPDIEAADIAEAVDFILDPGGSP